jgi:prolipoprotein diacylglyceryltransferase
MWSFFSAWGTPRVSLLGTAIIFIPTVFCFTKSMIILSDNSASLDASEKFWVFIPVSLIAGWTSLAIFLNWAPIASTAFGTSLYDISTNILVLVLALIWAANITYKSSGNLVFSFAILWGLSWLIVDFINSNNVNTSLGYTTILGIFLIIFITYASRSSTKKIEEKDPKTGAKL